MAFSYGFYNSLNGDRKYNAEQFSVLISCLITDGVLDNWGSMLMARPGTGGLSIVLGSGRAWFNDTWNENDSDIPFDLEFADPLLSRIDTLVLEVDKTVGIRANRVFIAKGTPATNAVPATLSNGPDIFQHALAHITVEPNAQTITADKIQILVGTESCPFITSILEQASIEELFAGWEYQFDTWFEELQTKLSGDVAANLQHQIELLQTEKVNVSDKASIDDISNGTSDKWVDSKNLGDSFPGIKTGDIVLSYRNLNDLGYQPANGQNIRVDFLVGGASEYIKSNLQIPTRIGDYDKYSGISGNSHTIRVLNDKILLLYELSVFMYDLSTNEYAQMTNISSANYSSDGPLGFIETSGDYFYVILPESRYSYGVWEVDQNGTQRSIGSIVAGLPSTTDDITTVPNILFKRQNGDILFFSESGTYSASNSTYDFSVGIISNRTLSIYKILSNASSTSAYRFNQRPLNWDSCNGGSKNIIERDGKIVLFYGHTGKATYLNWAVSTDNGKTWSQSYTTMKYDSNKGVGGLGYVMPLSDDEVFLAYQYGDATSGGMIYYKIKWDYTNDRPSEILDVFVKNETNGGSGPNDVLWGINSSPFKVRFYYMSGLLCRIKDKLFCGEIGGSKRAIIDLTSGNATLLVNGDNPETIGNKTYVCVYQSHDQKILVVMENVNYTNEQIEKKNSEILVPKNSGSGLRIMLYYLDTPSFTPRIFTIFTQDHQSNLQVSGQYAVTEDENFIYILHFGKLYKIDKRERRVNEIPYGWIKMPTVSSN